MDPALAAWITARILDGLDYAHRKGERHHRDLSPRNVMLSRDGEVKLVDFGIAVTLGDGSEGEDSRSAPTGSVPVHVARASSARVADRQTDLFSVGVPRLEMLAGQRLFARNDPDATLAAVLEAPIPAPSSVRPEVPAKLDEVVMRALERNRNSLAERRRHARAAQQGTSCCSTHAWAPATSPHWQPRATAHTRRGAYPPIKRSSMTSSRPSRSATSRRPSSCRAAPAPP